MEIFFAFILGVILFSCVILLIHRVCHRNVALKSKQLLLIAIATFWTITILFKKYYLDGIFSPVDGIIHESYARLIADHLRNLEFTAAMSYFGAGNAAYRFLIGVFYAVTNAPEVIIYAINGFAALWGSLILLEVLCRHTQCQRMPAWIILMTCLLPSTIFWTTANLKEGLVYWGICAMLKFTLYNPRSKNLRGQLLPIFGALVSGLFRPHIAIAYLTAVGVGAVLKQRRIGLGIVLICGVMSAIIGLKTLRPELFRRFTSEGVVKTLGNRYVRASGSGGSVIFFRNGTPTPIVSGLLLILVRPHPLEVSDFRSALAGVEVWGMTALIFYGWSRVRQRKQLIASPYFLTSLIAILLMSLFFSYMYNMGLMVRQRIMVFPLLFTLAAFPALIANQRRNLLPPTLKNHELKRLNSHRQRVTASI